MSKHKGTRNSVAIHFKDYISSSKVNMIEVCEWENGEGYDISFNDNKSIVGVTRSEWDAICLAVLTLDVTEESP